MSNSIVKEWITRAQRDHDVALKLLTENLHLEIALSHIQQAIEKFLKGYLIFNGWKLRKIHDLELLLTEAVHFDTEFGNYLELGRKLTAIYYNERYPPGPISTFSQKEINDMFEKSNEIINHINLTLKF